MVMMIAQVPKTIEKLEIQAYKRPKDPKQLRKTHVAFTGSPRKHPYDPNRVILVADPYSSTTTYYEFMKNDITYLEELPNLTNVDGDTVLMVRIWVKKRSIALRSSAFIVEDTGIF
jgi:inorganic pyrophosphatase